MNQLQTVNLSLASQKPLFHNLNGHICGLVCDYLASKIRQ